MVVPQHVPGWDLPCDWAQMCTCVLVDEVCGSESQHFEGRTLQGLDATKTFECTVLQNMKGALMGRHVSAVLASSAAASLFN